MKVLLGMLTQKCLHTAYINVYIARCIKLHQMVQIKQMSSAQVNDAPEISVLAFLDILIEISSLNITPM